MEGMEFKAHKVEQAIELGLKELQITAEEAEIEIVSQGGLFSKAVVKITPKIKPEQAAADFINNLFSYMKFDAYASLTKTEDGNNIEITGADSALAIGYRGDILDSVQYLALLMANKNTKDFIRISVNTENYREKRKEILTGLAKKLAQKADRTGRKVELEPMNPYERRIIHSALQDSELVTTESLGEEPNRYVVITPKNVRPNSDSRPYGGGGRTFNRDKKYEGGGYNKGGDRGRGNGGYGGGRSYDGSRGAPRGDRPYNGGGRSYNNGERTYGGERSGRGGYNGGGSNGGYNRGEKTYEPRVRPDYSEDKEAQTENVQRETSPETEKDYSEANSNFSNNFKKNGTKNFKSFGYKRR
ncbi:MAG: protein jag [Clostridiales bacterium]|nr:protein jag [Clostridiales bacterium]